MKLRGRSHSFLFWILEQNEWFWSSFFERYFTTNTVSVLSYENISTRTEFTGSDSIEGEYWEKSVTPHNSVLNA